MALDRKTLQAGPWPWLLTAALAALGLPARGDWLVARDGQLLETEGAWTVEGKLVKFKTTSGTLASMRASEIDLEASRAETARRAAPAPPPPAAPPQKKSVLVLTSKDVASVDPAEAAAKGAPVVLYMTSWCGYCRKARELLSILNEPYIEKDIETNPEGLEEYKAKGKGYVGVPLLDIGGEMVQGFREADIRRLVAARQEARRHHKKKD